VTVRRRVEALTAGDHRATRLGRGTELARIRPYVPGDDVRQLDWNVTARTGEPHVREQVAERSVTTWVVLDTSPSMLFGTADRRKVDVAEGVCLTAGHLAGRHGNRLGVVTFGGERGAVIPPRQGRAGILGLLLELRRADEPGEVGATSLGEGLARAARVARRPGLVLVVSDFRGRRDWRRPMLDLASRHDVVAVEIRDPREQALPDVGDLALVDPETGRQLRVDTRSRALRERFAAEAEAERRALAAALRRLGADHVVLSTAGDWLRSFAGFIRRRGGTR
jgi:uncharacterized protein (DUF58 family)